MRARRSVRLPSYDYAVDGVYFVTICRRERKLFFEGPAMKAIAEDCWKRIPAHHPGVNIDEWIVMPNHVHGLLAFEGQRRGVQLNAPTVRDLTRRHSVISPRPGTLPVLVRTYKAAVTTQCRRAGFSDFAWQRNYYEHIIRDDDDLIRVRQYILDNPLQWELDEYNPARVPVRT